MKVLVVATYPISTPRHGGQIRVRNLVEYYRSEGHSVKVIGVLGSIAYGVEDGFLPFPGDAIKRVCKNPSFVEDYCIGRLFAENSRYFAALLANVRERPDLVEVEQPWLFRFARRLVTEIYPGVPIIYGAQNVEHVLKRQILVNYRPNETVDPLVSAIETMEREAVCEANAVVAVSEADAEWLREQRSGSRIVVAPNGVSERYPPSHHAELVSGLLYGKHRFALYCASAHPPNIDGFFDLFSGGFGSLKPDERLVVAGGAGDIIAADDRIFKSAKLAERMVAVGVVDDDVLAALIFNTHCFVLPLTHGGGTNLKTAEALLSGKHMIATSTAMRGFEAYLDAPGVYVCDDASAFKKKLREVMEMPQLQLEEFQKEFRRAVRWEECLTPLRGLVGSFEKGTLHE